MQLNDRKSCPGQSVHICVCSCVTHVILCCVQGSNEEMESMIPQSLTPRLRRCGYCLLQVTSWHQLTPFISTWSSPSACFLHVWKVPCFYTLCSFNISFLNLSNSNTDYVYHLAVLKCSRLTCYIIVVCLYLNGFKDLYWWCNLGKNSIRQHVDFDRTTSQPLAWWCVEDHFYQCDWRTILFVIM